MSTAASLFRWDWREQPPMQEIAKAVAEISGFTVEMIMPETDSDEYELIVKRPDIELWS